jgi:large subunit ribosomal protein L23
MWPPRRPEYRTTMAKRILIKPIITEKADMLSEKLAQYSFVVDRKANKIEIKKAVEDMFNVHVESVNTMILPGKVKNRSTRTGILRGRKPAYKKAVVTLAEGETINLFGDL